eukprot:CAMPEP_0119262356 /NCGR_PEP_ID=MMETSP1329-20130426/2112_1 /TAXON_ID=114041 /ORGANISM="Genus nov. species nov., Strain RCC1024" /LENGTH=71 /DNA_ID=CAMNT_0007261991 /DNA_START=198 /DNA_END=409 /DNA_ORIENTATION=-
MILQGQLLLRTKGPREWTQAYFVLAVEEATLFYFGDALDAPKAVLALRRADVGAVEEKGESFRFSVRTEEA